ncbi:MAG: hypothetical protein HXY50_02195 [Ignavibacteriaceae bacterium]|nr:hypothetical protein [Ignavibacteriaceae bacterium]
MIIHKTFILKRVLPVVAGGVLGYAYYYFIGCSNGCPIQSNPYLSTFYGIAVGAVLSLPSKKKNGDTAK